MGRWAKKLFGKEKFERVGLVLAGTNKPDFEKEVLAYFGKVIHSRDAVYHAHLVKRANKFYPILTNIYGAPAMLDALTEIHDGGCRNLIFIGYAYGGLFRKNLDIGTLVLPKASYHFDGIYGVFDDSRTKSTPNRELRLKLKKILDKNDVPYMEGHNISVPSVTFQLPHEKYRSLKPRPITLEMELASFFSRARELGIRTAAVLVISDNRTSSIFDSIKSKIRKKAKLSIIRHIIDNLNKLDLPNLKTKKKFDISEHLGRIIEDPEDITNVYKKS